MKSWIITALLFTQVLIAFPKVITNDIKVYKLEQDLTHNTVISFLQDSYGFMWIGTFNGLNRYDGAVITSYRNDPKDSTTISNNLIIQMVEDRRGNIWFATGNGISRYNRNTDSFVQYHYNPDDATSISSDIASSVLVDSKGRVWIGCDQLCLYNPEQDNFTRFPTNGTPPEAGVNGLISFMLEDNNNDIWFVLPKEIHKLNSLTSELEMVYDGFQNPIVDADWGFYGIKQDLEGNYWISTDQAGIIKTKFENPHTKLEVFKEFSDFDYHDIMNTTVHQLVIIGAEIWFTVENLGVYVINSEGELLKRFIHDPANENSIAFNSIWSLYADRNERIWMGTWESGISIMDPYYLKFKHYKYQPGVNGLSLNNVKSFVEDKKGNIWIATDGGGLNYFDRAKNKFTVYKHDPNDPKSIGSDAVLDLAIDDKGYLWIGTWAGGINVFKNEEEGFIKYNTENSPILSNHCFGLDKGEDGKMYIASFFGGISIFDLEYETWEFYRPNPDIPDSLYNAIIFALNIDRDNNIWLSGESFLGLMRKNDEGRYYFQTFLQDPNDSTSISGNVNYTTYEDADNNFWVGTTTGLNLMDRKREEFKIFSTKDGLPNEIINSINGDKNGNLWIGTNKGLSSFNHKTKEIRNFTISDGIQGLQFNRNSTCMLSTGEMLVGGTNGFNIFYPDSIKDNPYKPNIAFTDFKIFYKSVPINSESILTKHINQTKEIKLSYKESVFTFDFVALNLTHPNENQYAYIMEGFEEEWNYVGNVRSATYTNLDAGKYTFRVKACNNDGEWNEDGISVQLRITPPFWKTWWFITFVIGLIIYSVYYFIRRREEVAKETKRILEEKVKEGELRIQEKVDELEEQKEEIKRRELIEQESRYMNKGLAEFSEIISSNSDNINELANSILVKIVSYVGVEQGAVFIHNQDSENPKLEIMGSYACNESILEKKFILENEGYVGACYIDNKIKIIDDLPEGYYSLESGLGSYSPKHLLDIPISFDVLKIGVIELASIEKIEDYKIKFLKKLCENLATIISANTANKNLQNMIEQYDQQAEELRAQEEEMRQNIEELMATQDEYQRNRAQYLKEIQECKKREQEYLERLKKK